MATTQSGNNTAERGTPLPQKSGGGTRGGKLSTEDKQERLDALHIVPQADSIPRLKAMKFNAMVERHKSASLAEKEAKKEKDEAGKDIMAALSAVGRNEVMNGVDKVKLVYGQSAARIDAKKLYELGVSEDIIAKATVLGNEFAYPLITVPKNK
jgi:hypothetical protein